MRKTILQVLVFCMIFGIQSINAQNKIVHDAEYYVIEAQNGERWATEDVALDNRLAELKKKHGKSPNIVYILWDDMAFGDAGIPAINKIRGFDTPQCNRMADEGIMFTRMYAEPSCTPTRAAFMTGRQPYRNGITFLVFQLKMVGSQLKKLPWLRYYPRQVMLQHFMAKGI